VLVTAMIMLFVMTMLMVTTMRTNVAEERMAGNARDWNTAFQAAESALRDAERDISSAQLSNNNNSLRVSGITGFSTDCSGRGDQLGLCIVSASGSPNWIELSTKHQDLGWTTGQDTGASVRYGQFTKAAPIELVAAQPRYIIEAIRVPIGSIANKKNKYVYRITAVGFGKNTSSRVMLQTVYVQF